MRFFGMSGSFIPFYEVLDKLKVRFMRYVGVKGSVHSLQVLCIALALSALHTFVLPSGAWQLGMLALATGNLGAQMYAAKSMFAVKALLFQFSLGSLVGLVICILFPSQWYFSMIGIFAAYAIWNHIRPLGMGSLAAVIVNVLFFDIMMPQAAGRQIPAVLTGAAAIMVEAGLGALMAYVASRVVNFRPTDAFSTLMRNIKKGYAALFAQAVNEKRLSVGVAETQAAHAMQLSVEAARVQHISPDEAALAQKLAEVTNAAYYHLYIFSRIKMNFTQRVKDEIKKSAYLYNDEIKSKQPQTENELGGLCYLHAKRFVIAYDAFVKLYGEWEEKGYAKRHQTSPAKNG